MTRPILAVAAIASALTGCGCYCSHIQPGEQAPDWRIPTTDGDTVAWSSLRGRPGMLVWIDPLCPEVEQAAQSQGALRLLESRWMNTDSAWVLYVASRTSDETALAAPMWRPWLKEMKLRGAVLADSAARLAKVFFPERAPAAVVIDGSGIVRWQGSVASHFPGAQPAPSLVLDSVLAGRAAPAFPETESGCRVQRRLW